MLDFCRPGVAGKLEAAIAELGRELAGLVLAAAERPLPRLPATVCRQICRGAFSGGQHSQPATTVRGNAAAADRLLSFRYDIFGCCGMIGQVLPGVRPGGPERLQ
eukprot:SAG22_NODE_8_length_37215_cov_120.960351_26_plen_105_part_00